MKLSEYERLNNVIAKNSKSFDPCFWEKMGAISGTSLKTHFELAIKRKLELGKLLQAA